MKTLDKKRNIFKWISFSLSILLNAFIIFYSCIDEETTKVLNRPFTEFFVNLVNGFNNKEVQKTPVEKIEICLASEESYVYNYIPGYSTNEIPLGSAKQIDCVFTPSDATDKSVSYSAEPSDAVVLNQNGSSVSVVGMKTGDVKIFAKSNDGSFISEINIKVVDIVAPTQYEISLDNTNIEIGKPATIAFDIDGGPLTHDELINFRYYDVRKLSYSSLDETVAIVDQNGVIYPIAVGSTTITVSNGSICSKNLVVSVTSGTIPAPFSSLSISGSDVCYANDMILDQNSNKNHYQLTPKDGETNLDPEDFIWSSSNDLLVRVDKHGVVRGFRKASNDDETAVITAKSKMTGQTASFEVTVKNQLPTRISISLDIGDQTIWNPKDFMLSVGDDVAVSISYQPTTQNKAVVAESSDESVLSITNQGSNLVIHALKEGDCTLTITSVINPDLTFSTKVIVLKAGAIKTDNFESVKTTIRKSLGHAAVFMVAQIFTYLTFYFFFYDKKWWFYSSISLGEGFFLSGLSEFIQFLVPSRAGSFIDVLINFAGVVVGAALTFLGIYIVKKIKEKKSRKETSENN